MYSFSAIVFFHAGYLVLLPDAAKPWFVLGLGLMMLPLSRLSIFESLSKNVIMICLLIAMGVIEWGKILWHNVGEHAFSWLLLGCIYTFVMLASQVMLFGSKFNNSKKELQYLLPNLAHAQGVIALYQLLREYGTFAVSVGWGGYALLVLGFSFLFKNVCLAQSSIIVFGLAASKALLYDVLNATALVRIFCLLLTGAVLYVAGFLLKKISEWK